MALSFENSFGRRRDGNNALVHVLPQRELRRLMAFAGYTIDDVVNNPLAKRDVYNWFRMSRKMAQRLAVLELERQWNPHR